MPRCSQTLGETLPKQVERRTQHFSSKTNLKSSGNEKSSLSNNRRLLRSRARFLTKVTRSLMWCPCPGKQEAKCSFKQAQQKAQRELLKLLIRHSNAESDEINKGLASRESEAFFIHSSVSGQNSAPIDRCAETGDETLGSRYERVTIVPMRCKPATYHPSICIVR